MNDDDLEFLHRLIKTYEKVMKATVILSAAFIMNVVLVMTNILNANLMFIALSYSIAALITTQYFRTLISCKRSSLEFVKRRRIYAFLSVMTLALLIVAIIGSIIDYRFFYFAVAGVYRAYTEVLLLKLLFEDFIDKLKKKIKNKVKSFKESFNASKNVVPVPTA